MGAVFIDKNAHAVVASLCGDDEIMNDTAKMILARARAEARKHRLTGQYMHNMKIIVAENRHGKDRLVVADDPGAIPIEFGHWTRRPKNKGRAPIGHGAHWVPGLHIMGNAYAGVRRVS